MALLTDKITEKDLENRLIEVKVEECVDFDHFSEWLEKQLETE